MTLFVRVSFHQKEVVLVDKIIEDKDVDLSDLYVDLSDFFVDLSDYYVVICMALSWQEHFYKIILFILY